MKGESGITGGIIRKQLREKIAALSKPRFIGAAGALSMILDSANGPLELPPAGPKFALHTTPPVLPNWHRVKLALLKSISTGCFIDLQFYAYNAIGGDLPLDPRPLFTSSSVINEWGPAITARKLDNTS